MPFKEKLEHILNKSCSAQTFQIDNREFKLRKINNLNYNPLPDGDCWKRLEDSGKMVENGGRWWEMMGYGGR